MARDKVLSWKIHLHNKNLHIANTERQAFEHTAVPIVLDFWGRGTCKIVPL